MFNINSKYNMRLLNISIRGISMLSRFLLIIVLAKLLTPADLGIFGLLVAGIGFAVLFVGFDYYSYSNREILSVKKEHWVRIIYNQIYAYVPLYLLFIPIAMVVNYYEFLPDIYFIWFILLMIVEHISIEQNRLLNTMQKQLSASIVLFLRSGMWVLFMLPIIVFFDGFRNLNTVLYAWFIGVSVSIVFGTFVIKKEINNWSFIKPDYLWILKGYKIGFLFILGTIAFKMISTFDRFWLEKISNSDIVGVYILYVSLAAGIIAFIHAGVIVFSTPKIIIAFQNGNLSKFKYLMNKFLKELIISILIMVIFISLLMPFVVDWIDKPIYNDNYNIFYIVLATASLTIINSHPSTYLYATKQDKYSFFSTISAFVVFMLAIAIFHFIIYDYSALYKVSLAVLISFIWLVLIKYFGYFYYSKLILKI